MYEYLAEFIGTFVFLFVILSTTEPFAIAMALMTAIYFGSKYSGGHFNPAVSVMMYLKGSIDNVNLTGYIAMQVLGGITAFYLHKAMNQPTS